MTARAIKKGTEQLEKGTEYWVIGKSCRAMKKGTEQSEKVLRNRKQLLEQSEKAQSNRKKLRANGNDCRRSRKKVLSNRKMALSNRKQLPMQSGTTGWANVGDCRVVSVCDGSCMHSTTAGHTDQEFWCTNVSEPHAYLHVQSRKFLFCIYYLLIWGKYARVLLNLVRTSSNKQHQLERVFTMARIYGVLWEQTL